MMLQVLSLVSRGWPQPGVMGQGCVGCQRLILVGWTPLNHCLQPAAGSNGLQQPWPAYHCDPRYFGDALGTDSLDLSLFTHLQLL